MFYGVVVLIVVAIPLFLVMYFSPDLVVLAILLPIVLGFIAIMSCLIVHHKVSTLPTKALIKFIRKITKGEYITTEKPYDNDLANLSSALNNTAYEFENIEQMRKNFISSASHELRSPLTSIQGFLQAVLDGTIKEEDIHRYLNIALKESKRLSTLINSMLDLSSLESGKNHIQLERFDINAIIRQVVEKFEPILLRNESTLDVDFARENSFVFADKEKIIQVLINLIDNAVKYSPNKSKILVTTHIHGKNVYVSVKDRGVGISKQDQELVWDRFFMVDKAQTPTEKKGTGLGLSIVKKIIEDHEETIWIESTKGMGSTFVFTLTSFDSSKHKIEEEKI